MRGSRPGNFASIVVWLFPAVLLLTPLFSIATVSAQEIETLRLSSAERAVLEKHGKIRLAVDIDWSPFEYIDDEIVVRIKLYDENWEDE